MLHYLSKHTVTFILAIYFNHILPRTVIFHRSIYDFLDSSISQFVLNVMRKKKQGWSKQVVGWTPPNTLFVSSNHNSILDQTINSGYQIWKIKFWYLDMVRVQSPHKGVQILPICDVFYMFCGMQFYCCPLPYFSCCSYFLLWKLEQIGGHSEVPALVVRGLRKERDQLAEQDFS